MSHWSPLRAAVQDGHKRVWSTENEPDGVLRKACGTRRAAVCPPCAERYRQDAFHLISAGLQGGKGVPDSIAQHWCCAALGGRCPRLVVKGSMSRRGLSGQGELFTALRVGLNGT
jgi:hypothetical protein